MAVAATYFTDPFCPWSWAAEPALRRLAVDFPEVGVELVMTGLARQVDEARSRGLAMDTLEAAAASGMPADARVWLQDPPASTYPAAIAVHAVAEQGDPGPFVRRLREAVYAEGRRPAGPEALLELAREAGVGNLDRLRIDFGSHAMLEGFGADLERSRLEEATSPAVRFEGPGGVHWACGWSWGDWEAAALAAGAERVQARLSVEDALRRFGTMATTEVAIVCDLPYPRAAGELWRAAMEWRATPRRIPGGELWAPSG